MNDHLTWISLWSKLDSYELDQQVFACDDEGAWEIGTVAQVKLWCRHQYWETTPVVKIGETLYYALEIGELEAEQCPFIEVVPVNPMVFPPS